MRRALVTGGTGFIGSATIRALQARGWLVHALGRRQASVETFPFDILTMSHGRLREILDRSRYDVVFHLAGTTSDTACEMERVNVGFAEMILEAAARCARPPAVVLAGTAAEYGELTECELPAREDHPCAPRTRYATTKLRQTRLGLAAARAGLTVYLPRMFNVIGAGMRPHLSLGRFAREIAALGPDGGVLTTGSLEAKRDFISVRDAVEVMIGLCQNRDAAGQVVNLCSGRPLRMADVVDVLLSVSGSPISVAIDSARSGVSAVSSMFGCTQQLEAFGFRIGMPDLQVEMARLLAGQGVARPLVMKDAE